RRFAWGRVLPQERFPTKWNRRRFLLIGNAHASQSCLGSRGDFLLRHIPPLHCASIAPGYDRARMDFTLTEDQEAFRDTARQFATDKMLPHAAKWDAEKIFPADTLREAAALGFGGIYVNDDVGGRALWRFDAALIMEELAAACPSTAAYISIHNMSAWMIDGFGDLDQRKRFLPKLCSMEHFASYCLTEPGAGSDAAALGTRAE